MSSVRGLEAGVSILRAVTAPFLILEEMTALFLSWVVPTLFFGRLIAL